jgi:ABC-type transport system involved in multi-copper enzyme maturation permease subunit
MSTWIMAAITFREAARKKILWTALLAGLGFLIVFGIGLRIQIADFGSGTPAFVRYQILSGMLMVGLYTVDLLAVVIAILTSVDTIAGEISTGTIHAIATKPMARWQIVAGKWLGFAAMLAVYVVVMFGGLVAVTFQMANLSPQHPVQGGLLIYLECLVALSVCFLFGTWFSTLTNGVIVLGLQGLAFLGGWLEQMSGLTEGSRLATVGIVASLLMPTEAVWRRATFLMESPLAGSLPQFAIFTDVSIPSPAMIVYATVYLIAVLGIAVYHFHRRDL